MNRLLVLLFFFHKFFMYNSTAKYNYKTIASTCVYLATKVDEQHTKARDIVNTSYSVIYGDKDPLKVGKEYWDLRDNMVQHELIVLRTLGFDMVVNEKPYKYLVNYIKVMYGNLSEITQLAWNIVNDTFYTTICIKYRPQVIAVVAIYIATKFLNMNVPTGKKKWFEVFDVTSTEINGAGQDILEMYKINRLKLHLNLE